MPLASGNRVTPLLLFFFRKPVYMLITKCTDADESTSAPALPLHDDTQPTLLDHLLLCSTPRHSASKPHMQNADCT
jgi:hypothetical protein